jgi:hypothetical protein
MTLVKAGKKCQKHGTALQFSQSGPAGPRGATGATGAPGAPGTPANQSQVTALQQQVATLTSEVHGLQSLLAGVTRNGSTLLFSGMNLQLESGVGSTTATPTAWGT